MATSAHDYVRRGTTDLFTAFNTRTGWVSAACSERHCTVDFLAFVDDVAEEYKDAPEVHVVLDNASIHSARTSTAGWTSTRHLSSITPRLGVRG